MGTGRDGDEDGAGESEGEVMLELEPSPPDFLKRLSRDSLACSLRESAPVPADLGRVYREGKEGLMGDSSRAWDREGRPPDGSGIAWEAGEAGLSPVRASGPTDGWSDKMGCLTSGSDAAAALERGWSTERLKWRRLRNAASIFSTGQDAPRRWREVLVWTEVASARTVAHSIQPFWRAIICGVIPCLSA